MAHGTFHHALIIPTTYLSGRPKTDHVAKKTRLEALFDSEDLARHMANYVMNQIPTLSVTHVSSNDAIAPDIWSDPFRVYACLFAKASRVLFLVTHQDVDAFGEFLTVRLRPLLNHSESMDYDWKSRFLILAMGEFPLPPYLPCEVIRFREVGWFRDSMALFLLGQKIQELWDPGQHTSPAVKDTEKFKFVTYLEEAETAQTSLTVKNYIDIDSPAKKRLSANHVSTRGDEETSLMSNDVPNYISCQNFKVRFDIESSHLLEIDELLLPSASFPRLNSFNHSFRSKSGHSMAQSELAFSGALSGVDDITPVSDDARSTSDSVREMKWSPPDSVSIIRETGVKVPPPLHKDEVTGSTMRGGGSGRRSSPSEGQVNTLMDAENEETSRKSYSPKSPRRETVNDQIAAHLLDRLSVRRKRSPRTSERDIFVDLTGETIESQTFVGIPSGASLMSKHEPPEQVTELQSPENQTASADEGNKGKFSSTFIDEDSSTVIKSQGLEDEAKLQVAERPAESEVKGDEECGLNERSAHLSLSNETENQILLSSSDSLSPSPVNHDMKSCYPAKENVASRNNVNEKLRFRRMKEENSTILQHLGNSTDEGLEAAKGASKQAVSGSQPPAGKKSGVQTGKDLLYKQKVPPSMMHNGEEKVAATRDSDGYLSDSSFERIKRRNERGPSKDFAILRHRGARSVSLESITYLPLSARNHLNSMVNSFSLLSCPNNTSANVNAKLDGCLGTVSVVETTSNENLQKFPIAFMGASKTTANGGSISWEDKVKYCDEKSRVGEDNVEPSLKIEFEKTKNLKASGRTLLESEFPSVDGNSHNACELSDGSKNGTSIVPGPPHTLKTGQEGPSALAPRGFQSAKCVSELNSKIFDASLQGDKENVLHIRPELDDNRSRPLAFRKIAFKGQTASASTEGPSEKVRENCSDPVSRASPRYEEGSTIKTDGGQSRLQEAPRKRTSVSIAEDGAELGTDESTFSPPNEAAAHKDESRKGTRKTWVSNSAGSVASLSGKYSKKVSFKDKLYELVPDKFEESTDFLSFNTEKPKISVGNNTLRHSEKNIPTWTSKSKISSHETQESFTAPMPLMSNPSNEKVTLVARGSDLQEAPTKFERNNGKNDQLQSDEASEEKDLHESPEPRRLRFTRKPSKSIDTMGNLPKYGHSTRASLLPQDGVTPEHDYRNSPLGEEEFTGRKYPFTSDSRPQCPGPAVCATKTSIIDTKCSCEKSHDGLMSGCCPAITSKYPSSPPDSDCDPEITSATMSRPSYLSSSMENPSSRALTKIISRTTTASETYLTPFRQVDQKTMKEDKEDFVLFPQHNSAEDDANQKVVENDDMAGSLGHLKPAVPAPRSPLPVRRLYETGAYQRHLSTQVPCDGRGHTVEAHGSYFRQIEETSTDTVDPSIYWCDRSVGSPNPLDEPACWDVPANSTIALEVDITSGKGTVSTAESKERTIKALLSVHKALGKASEILSSSDKVLMEQLEQLKSGHA